jgi:hypothetical protein
MQSTLCIQARGEGGAYCCGQDKKKLDDIGKAGKLWSSKRNYISRVRGGLQMKKNYRTTQNYINFTIQ